MFPEIAIGVLLRPVVCAVLQQGSDELSSSDMKIAFLQAPRIVINGVMGTL